MPKARSGFTLIEVMVAVMILSVAIAAIFEMRSQSTHLLARLHNEQEAIQYASLLSASSYGFETDSITLDTLVRRFNVDDALRRELKAIRAQIAYQTVERIDLAEVSDENVTDTASMQLEIGRSVLRFGTFSTSLLRIRLQ